MLAHNPTQPPATPPDHPASLVWLTSGGLEAPEWGVNNAFTPLPVRVALALVCMRRSGFSAQLIKRQALMDRNDDDNLFRNTLRQNAGTDPELTAMLDWNAARRTKEEDMVPMDVYAIEVEHQGSLWIMDGWTNLNEDQILAGAAVDAGRTPGYFTTPWAQCNDRIVMLDNLEKSSPVLDKVVAIWQSGILQRDTPEVSISPPRPRI